LLLAVLVLITAAVGLEGLELQQVLLLRLEPLLL
jgi:hypothetical protein